MAQLWSHLHMILAVIEPVRGERDYEICYVLYVQGDGGD